MRIYAVLDLTGGHVVHAVAGQRESYRPIASRLTHSSSPGDVARAIVETFGIRDAYVADLDAITGRRPDFDALSAIAAAGLRLIVDAGVGNAQRARELMDLFRPDDTLVGIIVGLETLTDRRQLPVLVDTIGSARAVLSLDLKVGTPLAATASLAELAPLEMAEMAWSAGFRRLIVLDLQSVGTAGGPATLELCQSLCQQQAWTEMISGGGVRGFNDLLALKRAGCHAALVATALHRGTLSKHDVQRVMN